MHEENSRAGEPVEVDAPMMLSTSRRQRDGDLVARPTPFAISMKREASA